MSRVFKAPKFQLKSKRVAEIPFMGNLATLAMVTVNSAILSYPFRVTKLKMIFTDEANNLVDHSWHILRSRFISTVAPPVGVDLFAREAPVTTFTGRSIIRVVPCNIEFPEGMRLIALYTNNRSPYAYDFNCSVTIEEM